MKISWSGSGHDGEHNSFIMFVLLSYNFVISNVSNYMYAHPFLPIQLYQDQGAYKSSDLCLVVKYQFAIVIVMFAMYCIW